MNTSETITATFDGIPYGTHPNVTWEATLNGAPMNLTQGSSTLYFRPSAEGTLVVRATAAFGGVTAQDEGTMQVARPVAIKVQYLGDYYSLDGMAIYGSGSYQTSQDLWVATGSTWFPRTRGTIEVAVSSYQTSTSLYALDTVQQDIYFQSGGTLTVSVTDDGDLYVSYSAAAASATSSSSTTTSSSSSTTSSSSTSTSSQPATGGFAANYCGSASSASGPDAAKPNLVAWSAEKSSVAPGEDVAFTFEVQETGSGMDYAFAAFWSPNMNLYQNDQVHVRWTCTADQKFWKLTIRFDSGVPEGQWKFSQLELHDNAGNVETFLRNSAAITLVYPAGSGTPDSTPPALLSWSADKTQVHPGEDVTFTFNVDEQGSGMDYAFAAFWSPNGNLYQNSQVNVRWTSNADKTQYILKIAFTNGAPDGQWEFSQLELHDKAGNVKTYLQHEDAVSLTYA